MDTLALTLHLPVGWHDLLIAELDQLDFEGFEEGDDHIVGYIPAARWTDAHRAQVVEWLSLHHLPVQMREELIAPRNWNAEWESTIQPLAVGPFLIRPSWHPVPPEHADKVELVIDPKMSFGTGYHETTRLVLAFLHERVPPGAFVLDAGTGTGILAIAALKLGAAHVVAFDIDPWADVNAAENALANDVGDRLSLREGGIEVVRETGFDLILANIQRSVLVEMLPHLAPRLAPGGQIILAGLLHSDRALMAEAIAACGLRVLADASENEWWACVVGA